MASLAVAPPKLTADQFFARVQGYDGKWELVDGELRMMTGGSVRHALVAGNIFAALKRQFGNTPCRAFNSDTGLKVNEWEVRYPDVAIYCDPRDLQRNLAQALAFEYPSVVFEVLSPTSLHRDRVVKARAYQTIQSLNLIVIVDADLQQFETFERIGPDEWRVHLLERGATLRVQNPSFELTSEDVFSL
jgi:Uma2 family endonuclease